MKKVLKSTLLIFIIVAGITSLVATSVNPPPSYSGPPEIWVITRNPIDEYERMNTNAYSCKGEELKLNWKHGLTETVSLSATPNENINPKLENKVLSRNGSLDITVTNEVKLTVNYSNKLERSIKMLPESLCKGFPMFPLAYYEGKLEQNQPIKQKIPDDLRLYWDAESNSLQADFRYGPVFNCFSKADMNQIICKQNEDDIDAKNLEIIFNVSSNKLTGSYKGWAKNPLSNWYKVSGTVNFNKKP